MFNYYSDTFARLSLSDMNDVGATAVNLVSSILRYNVSAIFSEDKNRERCFLAGRGIGEKHLPLWTPFNSFISYLWDNTTNPKIFKVSELSSDVESMARQMGMGGEFLFTPLNATIGYVEHRVGFIIASQAMDQSDSEIDLQVFETIAGVIAGAVSNSIIKEKFLESTVSLDYVDSVINTMADSLIVFDSNGDILKVNSATLKLLGYETHELVGQPSTMILTASDRFDITTEANRLSVEVKYSSKEGKDIPVLLSSSAILEGNGNINSIVCIAHDLTERKKMENDLLRVQKLESLGILAGGIAHDFNNILTAILGNTSIAKILLNPDDNVFEILTKVEKASLRARDLTQQLLTFSKGGAPVNKTISLLNILEEASGFALRGSNVKCEFNFPTDLWNVDADEGQISQVINNIVINALHAMPTGGKIKITASNIASIKDKVPITPQQEKYIQVSIEDNGCGICREDLSKIFDPYFTTKEKGSGLGLASSYSIIKNHNGNITVHSTVNKGTIFDIYLPASTKEITTEDGEDRKPALDNAKVLVMDDEESIREMLHDALQCIGYDVRCAKDGKEAIRLFKEARKIGDPFDVLIFDITIPDGMGGKETIKKLLQVDSEVKAIVSSGYSNDPIMSEFKKYGFKGVLPKPFNIKDMNELIRKLVE